MGGDEVRLMLVDEKKQLALDAEEESAKSGRSKVEHYKWRDPESPGKLMWIDKSQLVVDHKYQRDADSGGKVLKIASGFSWPVFGVLIVAHRAGKYFVVDGQHRHLGAMKRADVRKLPCLVFESEGAAQEASVFLDANSTRTGVHAVAKFRAQLVKKDPVALEVQRLIETSGRQVDRHAGPTSVSCIGVLCMSQLKSPVELARVWPLIVEVCRGAVLHERLVAAILYIERALPEGTSITDKRWSDRLRRVGPANLLESISRARLFRGIIGPRVSAEGVLQAINKGLSDANKLRLVGDEES